MGRVVHFEIHAEEPERAVAFYQSVFGWKFTQWEGNPYWLIETGPKDVPGIDGGLLPRNSPVEGTGVIAFVCTADVDDLDASMAAVKENGGSIAMEKQSVPGVGWLAYGIDTEGNIFGMMQSDPNAT
jgi:predicted enzyme related to lactoylglutathione lyase